MCIGMKSAETLTLSQISVVLPVFWGILHCYSNKNDGTIAKKSHVLIVGTDVLAVAVVRYLLKNESQWETVKKSAAIRTWE